MFDKAKDNADRKAAEAFQNAVQIPFPTMADYGCEYVSVPVDTDEAHCNDLVWQNATLLDTAYKSWLGSYIPHTRDCEIPFWQKEKVRLGEVVCRGIGSTVSLFSHTRYVIGEFRPPVYSVSVSDAWFQDWSNVSLDLAKSLFTRHQTEPENVGTSKLNSVGEHPSEAVRTSKP